MQNTFLPTPNTLKVAKGTYYNHIFRNKRERSQNALRRDTLRPVIKEIFDNSNQLFGADKITSIMNEQGYKVCNKTVLELMREMGLYSISTTSKKEYLKWKRGENRNIVHQEFKTSAPNKAWVSDITVFKYKDKYYYICVIIDLFSRKVISHRVSGSGSTQLVTRTFKQAYESRHPENDLVFHSDRGAPYLSYAFQRKLRDFSITQSLSRSGQPHDNAVSESFFSYLKKEELYRHTYRSESDLLKCIDSHMAFYNEKRPHSYLQYKTPVKFEELHLNQSVF